LQETQQKQKELINDSNSDNQENSMYSILDIHTIDKGQLAKQLSDDSQEGIVLIEIPKSGQLYFSERTVVHEDYLLCAYAYHLMRNFQIVSIEIPGFEEFYSFTFGLKVDENADFFVNLAEALIFISAGYGNDCFDAEDSASFVDDAYKLYEDWISGSVETDPAVLSQYQKLLTEWPLEEENDNDSTRPG